MAYFAEINSDNVVTRVVVVGNDQEHRGQEFLSRDLGLGGTWIQTSFNTRLGMHIRGGTPFRKNYAGVGFTFDAKRDAFIPPKPFPSWILNEDTCSWRAPVPEPRDGKRYHWNEVTASWVGTV